jgi:hypothetical protein
MTYKAKYKQGQNDIQSQIKGQNDMQSRIRSK